MSVTLHANTFGNPENPALLILHGLFGSSANWRSIARHLSQHFQVFTLDLRNHGQSPWHTSMTYHELASDVAAFVKAQSLDRPHLIGHSMGGKTAMVLLQHHLFAVGKTTILDIAPIHYSHNHDSLIDALCGLDLDMLDSRKQADEMLSSVIKESALRQFLLQNLVRQDGKFSWRTNLKAIRENGPSLFGYPDCPPNDSEVLFIRGEKSDYIQSKEVVETTFPNSTVRTIKDAGHWLHAEQPGPLLDLLGDYLKDEIPKQGMQAI